MPTYAPYGAWTSPISASIAAGHDGRPDWVGMVGEEVWWTEPRPGENGRVTLVRRRDDGSTESVLPAPWNVRSRVIEYGGAPWCGISAGELDGLADAGDPSRSGDSRNEAAPTKSDHGPLVVFVHFSDQRIYRYEPDAPAAQPVPLTPESAIPSGLRFVDLTMAVDRGEVWCVLEEFTAKGPEDVRRAIVAVPLDGSAAHDRSRLRELATGHRFLTGPKVSPDRRRAAWLAWDHPSMPWDGTWLRVADIAEDGTFGTMRSLAGGPEESVTQVEWVDESTLVAASDRTGWWNLHRIDVNTGETTALHPSEEEFAGPLWRLGLRWFAPLPDGRIAVIHGRGAQRLGLLSVPDPVLAPVSTAVGGAPGAAAGSTGVTASELGAMEAPASAQATAVAGAEAAGAESAAELTDVVGPWTEWAATLCVTPQGVIGVAASPHLSYQVVQVDTKSGSTTVLSRGEEEAADHAAYLPRPRERTFVGPGGREVHAHVYPPHNPNHTADEGELPPYVVWVHGGPTSRVPLVRDLEIAYFTSRGIGVAEVNYGGSTGYGREYRNRLRENWGVVDVEDCAAVAEALAAEGLADRDRLAIRGGSAGGWTSGASLTMTDVYRCGVIMYPILDLTGWASGETHDFESRYLESIVGPLPATADRYRERSPVSHADRLSVPFLLLQGLDDVICPPVQCQRFLEKVAGRGIPHAYLTFAGEGHGFRRQETIVACLESELSLYGQVFGFDPAGVPRLELTT